MKTKKLLLGALTATFILGAGYATASAEEIPESITPLWVPVDAYISPSNTTLTASSSNVTKTIGWGEVIHHTIMCHIMMDILLELLQLISIALLILDYIVCL